MALKLVYFPIRGRAEPIRLCLHDQGIAFEDNIVEFADWPAMKAEKCASGELCFGQIPVLEDSDLKCSIVQSDGKPWGLVRIFICVGSSSWLQQSFATLDESMVGHHARHAITP